MREDNRPQHEVIMRRSPFWLFVAACARVRAFVWFVCGLVLEEGIGKK